MAKFAAGIFWAVLFSATSGALPAAAQTGGFTCFDGTYNWGRIAVRTDGARIEAELATSFKPMSKDKLSQLSATPALANLEIRRLKADFRSADCVRSVEDSRLIECTGPTGVRIEASSNRFGVDFPDSLPPQVSIVGSAVFRILRIETTDVRGARLVHYSATLAVSPGANPWAGVVAHIEGREGTGPTDVACQEGTPE